MPSLGLHSSDRTSTRQSERTSQQTRQEFITSDEGVTFVGGVMYVNGAPQTPDTVNQWESSNGLTQYATVAWKDPATGQKRASCNCPGWAHKKAGQPRRCCHTDDLIGVAVCRKKRMSATIPIRSASQAAALIPKLDERRLRSIDIG